MINLQKRAISLILLIVLFLYYPCINALQNNNHLKSENNTIKSTNDAAQIFYDKVNLAITGNLEYWHIITPDLKLGYQHYLKLANKGDKVAQYYIAVAQLYELGIDNAPMSDTIAWLEKSSAQNYLPAVVLLAQFYLSGQVYTKPGEPTTWLLNRYWQHGFKMIQYAASQGNANAQGLLGYIYGKGHGEIKPNEYKSFNYFFESATQNYGASQVSVAEAFASGFGTKKDYKKAIYWFKKSIDNPNTPIITRSVAQHDLGTMYLEGQGSKKDYNLALYWFEQSEKNDNVNAAFAIAYMYHKGLGVKKSEAQTKYWLCVAKKIRENMDKSPCQKFISPPPSQ